MNHFSKCICAAIGSAAFGFMVQAGAQPTTAISTTQPFVMIVPWAQGGVLDGIARSFAPAIERNLGRKVVVANVPGEDSPTRHRAIQEAPSDGNTVALVSLESAMVGAKPSGFAVTGYKPLMQLASMAPVILLPANSPFRSVGELIAYARTNPGKLKASGSEPGGPWHLALVGLLKANRLTAEAVTWVPSEGAGPALQDLTAGALDFALMPAALATAQIQTGKITALAVVNTTRSSTTPSVPTVAQSGSAPYAFEYWIGIVGPPGMSAKESDQLTAILSTATGDATFGSALRGSGIFSLSVANRAAFESTLSKADADMRSLVSSVGGTN